jgi:formylglycine-generating enzyme required for sulfatase activity
LVLCTGLILPWWIITERTKQAAENSAQTDPATGPLRPEMVVVPQTVIPANTSTQQSAPPPQQTTPPLPFAISVTEITQGQYQRVIGDLPSGVHTATTGAQDACAQSDVDPNLPVVCVTWVEALEFCNRLSALEGLSSCYEQRGDTYGWLEPSCTGYRLPTKAEWQYAAQAASAFRYAGTDSDTDICRYANIRDQSASPTRDQLGCNDGYAGLAPVAHFLPNAWFVYDMTGNVAEWVWARVSTRAPVGASEAGAAELLGGDWSSGRNAASLNYAAPELPAGPSEQVGFRIARTDPQRTQ